MTLEVDKMFLMKYCPKCKDDQFLTDFYRNRSNPSGYQTYCKSCVKKAGKQKTIKRGIAKKSADKQKMLDRMQKMREAKTKNEATRKVAKARKRDGLGEIPLSTYYEEEPVEVAKPAPRKRATRTTTSQFEDAIFLMEILKEGDSLSASLRRKIRDRIKVALG